MEKSCEKTYRVIIADDDPASLELVRDLIESCLPLAEVETVSDGTTLVERMRDSEFDLVLTDNQMPRLTGRVAIQTVRELGYLTPMFLVSGDSCLPEIAKNAGASGYIPKGVGLKNGIEQIAARYLK